MQNIIKKSNWHKTNPDLAHVAWQFFVWARKAIKAQLRDSNEKVFIFLVVIRALLLFSVLRSTKPPRYAGLPRFSCLQTWQIGLNLELTRNISSNWGIGVIIIQHTNHSTKHFSPFFLNSPFSYYNNSVKNTFFDCNNRTLRK